jgi:DnaJ-class molecular chaperone
MNQIPMKISCNTCGGEGVLSTSQTFMLASRIHPLFKKWEACDGKGTLLSWVDMDQFAQILHALAVEE